MKRPPAARIHLLPRLAVVISLVASVMSMVPAPARAATTTTLVLQTKNFPAPNGYKGYLLASRNLSASSVDIAVILFKTQTGTTGGGKSEDAQEAHEYFFSIGRGLQAKPDLSSGSIHTGAKLQSFGAVNMLATALHPAGTKRTCNGRVVTKRRPVELTGTFRFLADAPGQSFFGTISFSSLKGTFARVTDATGGQGCTKPPPTPCATGYQLSYFKGAFLFAAANVTFAGSTEFEFLAVDIESRDAAAEIVHLFLATTPDTSAFSSQPDLTSAHLDTATLNLTGWIDGATDFTSDGNPPHPTTETCDGNRTQPAQFTQGTLSAAITVTFDGLGQVANDPGTDTPEDTNLLSVAAPVSATGQGHAIGQASPPELRAVLRTLVL